MKPIVLRLVLWFSVVGALAGVRAWQLDADPDVAFLANDGQADWIVLDRPFNVVASRNLQTVTVFQRRFSTRVTATSPELRIRAMRGFTVHLDGELVGSSDGPQDDWKTYTRLMLADSLPAGEHTLTIICSNRRGPAALAAYSPALDLKTNATWEATRAGQSWRKARLADQLQEVSHLAFLPTVTSSLAAVAPWLLIIFAITLVWTWKPGTGDTEVPPRLTRLTAPGNLRWLLMGLWLVLGINNLPKLANPIGFDVSSHVEYMSWIADRYVLPLATDGWQTFQAPLYYIVSAPLYKLFSLFMTDDNLVKALRVIPLACGLLQIEIIFRCARLVFRGNEDLQRVALLVGASLPMHIYISQVVGNEPLAGLLTSLTILLTLRLLEPLGQPVRWRDYVLLGLAWGGAMLTKTTAVLLALPLLLAAVVHFSAAKQGPHHWLSRSAVVLAVALVVCGWYYVRNWVELGQPFIGGWDPLRGIEWWQDPGYRTWSHLLSFGASLHQPVFSATAGWWDGLHSTMWLDGFAKAFVNRRGFPPWNMQPMIAGAALGFIPAALMAAGSWRGIVSRTARPSIVFVFAAVCIGTYLAAMLDLFLRLPIYSTVKATYMLGLLPCFGILAAAGFEPLSKTRRPRALAYALLACWACTAYAAYWA